MLFRPPDTKPLDYGEEDEWHEMQRMGRAAFVVHRTGAVLGHLMNGVAIPVGLVWYGAPESRHYLGGRFLWIPLAVGALLVGGLAAASAWDTWRSYDRRSRVDDDPAPLDEVARLMGTSLRYTLLSSVLATCAVILVLSTNPRSAFAAVAVVACLLSWRSVWMYWRNRSLFKPKP